MAPARDRILASLWWPDQFRLLLASLACTLVNASAGLALKSTGLPRAQVVSVRLKLLGIGAVTRRNTRRARFRLSSLRPASSSRFVYLVLAVAA